MNRRRNEMKLRIKWILASIVLVVGGSVPSAQDTSSRSTVAPTAIELIQRVEKIMYPDAKAVATLHFRASNGREENYGMIYYTRDRNQKIIVRMTAPDSVVGNDLLMIEQNVWAYDNRSNRIMKIASNQSFGATGFSYGDVVRLNFSDNYNPELKNETADEYQLELTAKDRGAPYYRIELDVAKQGGWPLKGVYRARNGSVVKEIRYSDVRNVGAGQKPLVLTVITPLDPGAVNVMSLLQEEFKDLPDRIFNKRNLETRTEEKL
jgi:outer membrane lipoprotein-sorting protein